MDYSCWGSGSSGNFHVLKSSTGCTLCLDMGFTFSTIKKRLNFNLRDTYFIVSHVVHSDHGKGYNDAVKAGCDCYHSLPEYQPLEVGEFTVIAFPVIHNVPTQGFLVNHPEMGNLLYLTDTGYVEYRFENIQHYLIEANFDEEIILDSVMNETANNYLSSRIWNDHLSIQSCLKILGNQDLSMTETIILGHLSSGNSDAEKFKRETIKATGKTVHIADKGLKLNLSLNGF